MSERPPNPTPTVRRQDTRLADAKTRAGARLKTTARTPAPAVIEITTGDTLRIAASRVACVVTANGVKSGVLCLLLADLATPLARSYAAGLAEDGEAILVAYDKSSTAHSDRLRVLRYLHSGSMVIVGSHSHRTRQKALHQTSAEIQHSAFVRAA